MMMELVKQSLRENDVPETNIISINFDNLQFAELLDYKKLHDHIMQKAHGSTGTVYVFLDELQEVQAWEKCVNSLRSQSHFDIYVTGSNSHLLSSEYATYLAGRYVSFTIYPFSFKEFTDVYRQKKGTASVSEMFTSFIEFGGMPGLSQLELNADVTAPFLQDIYNSVVLKDVIQHGKIHDTELLERICRFVMANAGKTFSATGISKYLKNERRKTTPETVLHYLICCEDAYLFYKAKRYDVPGKKMLSVQEKEYIADHGLRQAVVGRNTDSIETVLENIVYLELLRRGYTVYVGKIEAAEIDFIAEKQNGAEKMYIQVAYLLSTAECIEREFSPLEKISDNFPKLVLSTDPLPVSGRNGIERKDIAMWLLEE